MFLPARSSLYAVFPSVGSAIAVAALLLDRWVTVDRTCQQRAIVAGLCAPFLLWPLYAARNRPAVREAELSTATLDAVREAARRAGAGAAILLVDDRRARPSFDNAFGTLAQEASDLMVQPGVEVWIEPPPTDAARASLRPARRPDVVLALRNGKVLPEP